MKIYIVEDDLSVINILEDIIETQDLGEICGDCGGEPANLADVLRAKPDVILVDFFMPVKDGVEFVKELRAVNTSIKCIMISQVSAKELISKAYSAGVDFFISKPINLIEVRSVLKNVEQQITNERTLANIRRMFMNEIEHPAKDDKPKADNYGRKLKYILNRIGMSGEKGCPDIIKICEYLHDNHIPVSNLSVAQMCEAVSDSPKNMEQRVRRTIAGWNVQHCPHGDRGFHERDLHSLLRNFILLRGRKSGDGLSPGKTHIRRQGQHQKIHRRADAGSRTIVFHDPGTSSAKTDRTWFFLFLMRLFIPRKSTSGTIPFPSSHSLYWNFSHILPCCV